MNMSNGESGLANLAHWGVIRAQGADAVAFLQGQLTNDVTSLSGEACRLAGFCSAKGRLQATFLVWKGAHDDVLLACSRDLLAATLKRLSMFVLRAKCKLSDATSEVPLHGALGEPAQPWIDGLPVWGKRDVAEHTVLRLPDATGRRRALIAGALPQGSTTTLSLDHWRWHEVRSGVPWIEAATVDQFVPQMLNYELLGGVDFQKGCYPGQEVVARSQYRGTLKRRMFLFESDMPLAAGQEVVADDDPGQPAGMVVNAAPGPEGGWSALVEAKLAALESGRLHLGSVDGPALRRAELPYALP